MIDQKTVDERRAKWASPPIFDIKEAGTFKNVTDDKFVTGTPWSMTTSEQDIEPRYSYLGLGLAVMSLQYPVEWRLIQHEDGNIRWAVDETTDVLSEYYMISITELDNIYYRQFDGATRQELNQIMIAAPVYRLS